MSKTKDEVRTDGRAVFYTILYQDFRKAALECGYALAIHGSMSSDMDLIAVAWTEDARDSTTLVKRISDCIGNTVWKDHHLIEVGIKPYGRIAYSLSIFSDWQIDLSIIPPNNYKAKDRKIEALKDLHYSCRSYLDTMNYSELITFLDPVIKRADINELKTVQILLRPFHDHTVLADTVKSINKAFEEAIH
jgi:hypothetical protein